MPSSVLRSLFFPSSLIILITLYGFFLLPKVAQEAVDLNIIADHLPASGRSWMKDCPVLCFEQCRRSKVEVAGRKPHEPADHGGYAAQVGRLNSNARGDSGAKADDWNDHVAVIP